MVLTAALLLTGCEAQKAGASKLGTGGQGNAIAYAQPGSDRRIGALVGWRNRLYVLTKGPVGDIGEELDRVTYRGTLGESFVVLEIKGTDPAIAIAMQALDGEFFKAVAVEYLGGLPLSSNETDRRRSRLETEPIP